MPTLAIVGGQYGSEGKGVIAHSLATRTTAAVRTGGPNAGHSIIHEGRVWKMRSVPVAWTNPSTTLLIGPGAVVDPVTLIKEVEQIEAAGYQIKNRLRVDARATMIIGEDHEREGDTLEGGGLHLSRIGSTLEGVGAARIRRIARDDRRWVRPADLLPEVGIDVGDTLGVMSFHHLTGNLMLEGTQGFGLSLHHGTWPWVTSADCTVQQLANDAGVGIVNEALVVFRSFPIRVGGPSGPMKDELTWDRFPGVEPERTTVTNKVRRIAEFDWDLSRRSILVNGATAQALTFADYIDPEIAGVTSWHALSTPVRAFIDQLEDNHGVPVVLVGTGGPRWSVVSRPDPALHYGGTGFREVHPRAALN